MVKMMPSPIDQDRTELSSNARLRLDWEVDAASPLVPEPPGFTPRHTFKLWIKDWSKSELIWAGLDTSGQFCRCIEQYWLVDVVAGGELLRKGRSLPWPRTLLSIDTVITIDAVVTSIAIVTAMVSSRMASKVASLPWPLPSISLEAFSFAPLKEGQYFYCLLWVHNQFIRGDDDLAKSSKDDWWLILYSPFGHSKETDSMAAAAWTKEI